MQSSAWRHAGSDVIRTYSRVDHTLSASVRVCGEEVPTWRKPFQSRQKSLQERDKEFY